MRFFVLLIFGLLVACESNPPAPVIDRTPDSRPKPPASKPSAAKTPSNTASDNKVATIKDWRPDQHIVKKGETLFGIGLEYGVDYKEIAAANHIDPPYPIKIGQLIDLKSFKTKPPVESSNTDVGNADDSVVITPMKTEPNVVGDQTVINPNTSPEKPIIPAVTPVLSEPKALREPYSLAAMNRAPVNTVTKPAGSTSSIETKPNEAKPSEIKPTETVNTKTTGAITTGDEAIAWNWPTQGKITAGFNEATNKGVDIAGETGQAIKAASAGKVIYSGSDLRGYGKLVIVKHNKTYLSVYAHNSKIVVKEGQSVVAGQKIAEMGNTDSNTTKLHFEIRRLGKSVDPAKYLNQN